MELHLGSPPEAHVPVVIGVVTPLEMWWIQAATEGLALLLAGGPSYNGLVESVSDVVDGAIEYSLRPASGLRAPRLEARLEALLAAAKDPVDVVGLAVTLSILLSKVGEESRAKDLLDRDHVLEAYAVLMSLAPSRTAGDNCPRCDPDSEDAEPEEAQEAEGWLNDEGRDEGLACMCRPREAKWRRYMEFERRHHGLDL
jgi:hypothetical protein